MQLVRSSDLSRLAAAGRVDSLALLDALPAPQRDAVRARVIDGREYEELAREFACSELVVRRRVSSGLRSLRALAGYPR
jgi:DNA-directed RNA polymerase specialized sigma24 family protein